MSATLTGMAEQETFNIRVSVIRDEPRAKPLSAEEIAELDDFGLFEIPSLIPSWRELRRAPSALLTYLRSAAAHLR